MLRGVKLICPHPLSLQRFSCTMWRQSAYVSGHSEQWRKPKEQNRRYKNTRAILEDGDPAHNIEPTDGRSSQFTISQDSFTRRPKSPKELGLRGKEIGLFYNKRSKANKEKKMVESRAHVELTSQFMISQGTFTRHPKSHKELDLKGKEIGLFYAKRGKANKEKKMVQSRAHVELTGEQHDMTWRAVMEANTSSAASTSTVMPESDGIDDDGDVREIDIDLSEMKESLIEETSTNDIFLHNSTSNKDYRTTWQTLRQDWQETVQSPSYQSMLPVRQKLPISSIRQQICETVSANRVVIVCGETGCGKSTQVPQFLLQSCLEDMHSSEGVPPRIIVTEPRRISALTMFQRVRQELGSSTPFSRSVGYQVRLEGHPPERTEGSILYCTTGVLLQHARQRDIFKHISHLLMDEVHERNVDSDLLLALVRDLLQDYPHLHVVLMSASINSEQFSAYLGNCPIINVPGRMFHVETVYLEDFLARDNAKRFQLSEKMKESARKCRLRKQKTSPSESRELQTWLDSLSPDLNIQLKKEQKELLQDLFAFNSVPIELVVHVVEHIIKSTPQQGAVLVFLEGMQQISLTKSLLLKSAVGAQCEVHSLHSMFPLHEQQLAFNPPSNGKRKVVLATNIAETTVTINDVVHVVDCGRMHSTDFDMSSASLAMQSNPISLANVLQRKGRAGRVQPGQYYALYTRFMESRMEPYMQPEILRTRLEEVILKIKSLNLGNAKPFLQRCLSSPEPELVEHSLEFLHRIGALNLPTRQNPNTPEALTPLGLHLAHLGLPPQVGKMILYGALFGCVEPVLSVAASMALKSPFYFPQNVSKSAPSVSEVKEQLAQGWHSDHLALVRAVELFEVCGNSDSNMASFCHTQYLSLHTMRNLVKMKRQLARLLYERRYLTSHEPGHVAGNVNSIDQRLVSAIILAGLYPNLVQFTPLRGIKSLTTEPLTSTQSERLVLGDYSVNGVSRLKKVFPNEQRWLTYFEKMKLPHDSVSTVFDSTVVGPMAVLLFSRDLQCHGDTDTIIVDGWIHMKCSLQTRALIMELRKALNEELKRRATTPQPVRWDLEESGAVPGTLATAVQLLCNECIN